MKVPCLVEVGIGEVDIHVGNVDVFIGLCGEKMEEVNVLNREGHIGEYKFVGIDNVRVFCWSNVHPSEWYPELLKISEMYVEGV